MRFEALTKSTMKKIGLGGWIFASIFYIGRLLYGGIVFRGLSSVSLLIAFSMYVVIDLMYEHRKTSRLLMGMFVRLLLFIVFIITVTLLIVGLE